MVLRRTLLKGGAIAGAGMLVSAAVREVAAAKTPSVDPYAAQVDVGLGYFRQLAQRQLPLAEKLLQAVRSGDLAAADNAYIQSRPPYEQIEVLALCFEQTDRDIDARPYAFEHGEADAEFRGFHRIEAFIYRDRDLTAAIPYAEGLVSSVRQLIADLEARARFSSSKQFEGSIALATEVPAKKISSEEETWSDQSLLIFRENWRGIYSQIVPYASLLPGSQVRLAEELKAAYMAALATVEPYFTPGQVAARPYSTVGATARGAIVKASYRFRDAIVAMGNALGIEA